MPSQTERVCTLRGVLRLRSGVTRGALALVVPFIACLGSLPGAASAASPTADATPTAQFRNCGIPKLGPTQCADVRVPVDRSGTLPGDLALSVRRVQVGQKKVGVRKQAVVFLAGGPGQATTPLLNDIAPLLRPFLTNRDLVTIDTRGTGRASDLVVCPEVEALPPFVRARELLLNGMAARARAEWRFGQDRLSLHVQPQVIHLAASWGWHQHAVATATGQRVFFDYALLYPRPYDEQVARAAEVSGLDPSLIYGVIRQESLYQSDAVSSANARGLMQLLLETARRTARQWNLPAPTATSLFEPAANVMLGATHLKDLVERFGGQLPLALAGYNAGPGAAQRWLPADPMDPDIWIENIPYNETRNYVQRIHWHTVVFGWLHDGQAQDTSGWLQPVTPP